ncbi:MAG: hypothetical protein N4A47_01375 [Clostridia bacterium]|jgi:hypothetical protein|nr:hypothetical protein [Clostridia bacterium]
MFNLLKYEAKKVFAAAALWGIIIGIIDILLMLHSESSIFLYFILLSGLFGAFVGYSSMVLSKDLNTKSGYNLFMLPVKKSKIYLSKFIISILAGFMLLVFYGGLGIINAMIILKNKFYSYAVTTLIEAYNSISASSYDQVGIAVEIMQQLFIIFTAILILTAIIHLAVIIEKMFFSNIKFGKVLNFVIFGIGAYLLYGKILPWIIDIVNPSNFIMIIINMIILSIFTVINMYLIDNKVDI